MTVGGVAAGILGLYLFGTLFLTPSATFFADPLGTIDTVKANGFFGILLMSAATFVAPFGVVLTCIALALETVRSDERRRFA